MDSDSVRPTASIDALDTARFRKYIVLSTQKLLRNADNDRACMGGYGLPRNDV